MTLDPEQLAAQAARVAALEAKLKALVAAEEGRHSAGQLSDTRIADAAALGEEPPMCDIKGPYKDRKSWRVRIVDTLTGKKTTASSLPKTRPTKRFRSSRPSIAAQPACLSWKR